MILFEACLKPIGAVYRNKTLDTDKQEVKEVSIDPANGDEIEHTRKVMGGEDWKLWTELLLRRKLACRRMYEFGVLLHRT